MMVTPKVLTIVPISTGNSSWTGGLNKNYVMALLLQSYASSAMKLIDIHMSAFLIPFISYYL